jgi:hypothetical protein
MTSSINQKFDVVSSTSSMNLNQTIDSPAEVLCDEHNLNDNSILRENDESFIQPASSEDVTNTMSKLDKVFESEELDIYEILESVTDTDDVLDSVMSMNSQISKNFTLDMNDNKVSLNFVLEEPTSNEEIVSDSSDSNNNDIKGVLLLNNKSTEKFYLTTEEIELLTNHPFTEIVPVISAEENMELTEDIMASGFLDTIIITKEGQIVDGRARVEIAKNKEVLQKPMFEFYKGLEDHLLDFILSKNVIRRHLNQGQKAAASLKLLEIIKKENKIKLSLKMKKLSEKCNEPENNDETKIDSRAEVAKYFNVSSSYVAKAKAVQDTNPDLLEKVLNGTEKLEDVYKQVKKTEFVPKATQENIIADYENNFTPLKSIEKIVISFLSKLGVSDTTAAQIVIKKAEKEETLKKNWESQSDNIKFEKYLADFIGYMKRNFIDSESMKEFELRINMSSLRSQESKTKTLTERILELKSFLNEDEIVKLNLCIKEVDRNKSELLEEETLLGIIKQFNSQINEMLNDKVVE